MNGERSQAQSLHIESHAELLHQPSGVSMPGHMLDALIVPTVRPHHLPFAAALATEVGCALVALCSTPEQARHAQSLCEPTLAERLITYVPGILDDSFLPTLTAGHPENEVQPSCHRDIARKRNVGLLLARLCGWRTIMFLDDDIRDITASDITSAAALTADFDAVGFAISYYPDNSVVCHAHRLAGGEQDTFLSAGALVVNVGRHSSPFPPIYNEDWLFLYGAVQRRSVAVVNSVAQLEYSPFARPLRAASEEFGDVVAEGLFRLLHTGGEANAATCDYWIGALERRLHFIDDVAARLMTHGGGAPIIGPALMSLAAARKRLSLIPALSCVSFIHAWQADLENWSRRLSALPQIGDLAGAAKHLDLPSPESCVRP